MNRSTRVRVAAQSGPRLYQRGSFSVMDNGVLIVAGTRDGEEFAEAFAPGEWSFAAEQTENGAAL